MRRTSAATRSLGTVPVRSIADPAARASIRVSLDLALHQVVVDPAELEAHDAVPARFVEGVVSRCSKSGGTCT